MNNIKVFQNKEFGKVRSVMQGNEAWFVGKDVAIVLGYKDTADALKKHVDEEEKMTRQIADSLGRKQNTYLINESGLYSLILSSKLPSAKRFKRWVTGEVLPSIRQHGAFMTENTIEKALSNPDFLIQLATKLNDEKEKRVEVEKQIEQNKPKVIFVEAVQASKNSILVGDLAKILKQNGIDTGANRLFNWLRSNGYLIKRKGTDYNMPTQRAMELKLFEVKETSITHGDGHITVNKTPKVTGKGQIYFINKFQNRKTA